MGVIRQYLAQQLANPPSNLSDTVPFLPERWGEAERERRERGWREEGERWGERREREE